VRLTPIARKAQIAERLHAGSLWTDTGFVFTTETGQPVDPRNLYRVVQTAAARAGLKHVGVHSLRHSAATAMLEAGVNIVATPVATFARLNRKGRLRISPETAYYLRFLWSG
jgi:site-specific recombinase XerD